MNDEKEENKTEDEEEREREKKSAENQKRWICLSRLMSVWLNTSEGEHAVI